MKGFLRRRLLWGSLLVAATVAVASVDVVWVGATTRSAYLTGWLLFGVMVLLTGYNWFKKIPYLPLGRSEVWLQFHIYAGLFTGVLFLLHVRLRWPTGWFEGVLTVLYAIVMVSGVLGIIISRGWPQRLTARGGEVPFERIPIVRRQLREQAEALALNSVAEAKSATIAEFYTRRLHPFFAGHRAYSPGEFRADATVHAIGVVGALSGSVILLSHAGVSWVLASLGVFLRDVDPDWCPSFCYADHHNGGVAPGTSCIAGSPGSCVKTRMILPFRIRSCVTLPLN